MKFYQLVLLIIAIAAVALLANYVFSNHAEDVENQTGVLSMEERCDFVVKSTIVDGAYFEEPTAGSYNYELYITPDGYIEVWKCPPHEDKK